MVSVASIMCSPSIFQLEVRIAFLEHRSKIDLVLVHERVCCSVQCGCSRRARVSECLDSADISSRICNVPLRNHSPYPSSSYRTDWVRRFASNIGDIHSCSRFSPCVAYVVYPVAYPYSWSPEFARSSLIEGRWHRHPM